MSDVSQIGSNAPLVNQNIQNAIQKSNDDEFQNRLKKALDSKDEKEIKKVSKDLESVFVNEIFKEMRKTIDRSSLIESDTGRDMYESMLDENVANEISKGKGIGLADMIYKQVTSDMKNQYKVENKED